MKQDIPPRYNRRFDQHFCFPTDLVLTRTAMNSQIIKSYSLRFIIRFWLKQNKMTGFENSLSHMYLNNFKFVGRIQRLSKSLNNKKEHF